MESSNRENRSEDRSKEPNRSNSAISANRRTANCEPRSANCEPRIALSPNRQPIREARRQARGEDPPLRRLHRVGDPAEQQRSSFRIEDAERRARIAVARLADRSHVDQIIESAARSRRWSRSALRARSRRRRSGRAERRPAGACARRGRAGGSPPRGLAARRLRRRCSGPRRTARRGRSRRCRRSPPAPAAARAGSRGSRV